MPLIDVEVRTFREVDLTDGTVVEAFPTVGLVSTIAASYMIGTLDLDQICALESEGFPPLSMIYARKPKFPARVYADEDRRFAVFICEVPLPPPLHRPVSYRLLDWSKAHGVERVLSLEGLPRPEGSEAEDPRVLGVASTEAGREELEAAGIAPFETGMIAGTTGVLLNEGRWRGVNVISLLAEANPQVPDPQAAIRLVEAVNALMEDFDIDLGPLREQAERIGAQLQAMQEEARPAVGSEPGYGVYR